MSSGFIETAKMDSLTKPILSLCLLSFLCVNFIESLSCLFTKPVTRRGYLLPKQSALMDIDTFTTKVYRFAIYRYAFTQVARTPKKLRTSKGSLGQAVFLFNRVPF